MNHPPPDVPLGHTFVGYTPDGQVITATSGIVYDDAYIAAEEQHAQEQRAAVIAEYGSLEAYDKLFLASVKQIRRDRREAIASMRIDRARRSRNSRVVGYITPRTREHQPIARRRAASSSTTSSADPGDPDPDPPGRRGELRHISTVLADAGWPECSSCGRKFPWRSTLERCALLGCTRWQEDV